MKFQYDTYIEALDFMIINMINILSQFINV